MPKAKIKQKERAQVLRKGGKSIKDISSILKVSKSSASYWCRDIKLSPTQILALSERQRNGAIQAGEKKRQSRIDRTTKMMKRGEKDVGKLSKRDLFIVGLALYWGEGYKKGSQETGLTNSDPEIIKLFIVWLEQVYDIPKNDLILRVSINSIHKDREREVVSHWSRVADVPNTQFTKTSFIKTKAKKVYSNDKNYFGTLRVKVRRGTDLRRRILGSIEALKV
jgi:hypothetical protein